MRTILCLLALASLSACNSGQTADGDAQSTQAAASAAASEGGAESAVAKPATATPDRWALTCDYPVKRGASADDIEIEFGKDATWETLIGAEGMEYRALVLWAKDPERRLELPFNEEDHSQTITSIYLGEKARWQVAGLELGDPLSRVREANGRPFKLRGFDWDYGGLVSDWQGGKLPGRYECSVMVTFEAGPDAGDDYAMGDSEFSSDDPKIAKAKARIATLGISLGGRE